MFRSILRKSRRIGRWTRGRLGEQRSERNWKTLASATYLLPRAYDCFSIATITHNQGEDHSRLTELNLVRFASRTSDIRESFWQVVFAPMRDHGDERNRGGVDVTAASQGGNGRSGLREALDGAWQGRFEKAFAQRSPEQEASLSPSRSQCSETRRT